MKGFADGSLGSRTAYFFEPLQDDPRIVGLLRVEMQPLSAMRERMMRADAAGLQVWTHAIGDRAISTCSICTLKSKNPTDPATVASASSMLSTWRPKISIVSRNSMSSPRSSRTMPLTTDAGPKPASATIAPVAPMPSGLFLNHGVRLAFGTDWEVAPLDPLLTIYAAVTRATLDGKYPGRLVSGAKVDRPGGGRGLHHGFCLRGISR